MNEWEHIIILVTHWSNSWWHHKAVSLINVKVFLSSHVFCHWVHPVLEVRLERLSCSCKFVILFLKVSYMLSGVNFGLRYCWEYHRELHLIKAVAALLLIWDSRLFWPTLYNWPAQLIKSVIKMHLNTTVLMKKLVWGICLTLISAEKSCSDVFPVTYGLSVSF